MKLTPRQQAGKERYLRKKYSKDLIQPSDNRFKTQYPKQYAQMEKAREYQDLKAKQEIKSKDEFLREHRHDTYARRRVLNALKLEEAIEEHGK